MQCTQLSTRTPILRLQFEGATSSSLRGNEEVGALITPTIEGANIIAAGFDITNRDVERLITVCATARNSPPTDSWDTVEEVDITTNGHLEITNVAGDRLHVATDAISHLTGQLRVRVSARARDSAHSFVDIEVWPSAVTGLVRLRHKDRIDLSVFGSRSEPTQEPVFGNDGPVESPVTAHLSATPRVPLREAWIRLVSALNERGLNGLASDLSSAQDVGFPEAETPGEGNELAQWFDLVGTLDDDSRRSLVPGFDLLTTTQSAETRGMLLNAWESQFSDEQAPRTAAASAFCFISDFVVIAERDATLLVVDVREGELHGCVTRFDKVDADAAGPSFRSLGSMLHDVSVAISLRQPVFGARSAIVDAQL